MALTTAEFLSTITKSNTCGIPTTCNMRDGIPYFEGQFWTAKQRQGHSIHEISYRACFKSELPAFFIDSLTDPGDIVLDPFAGRGTTPLQAALMNRRSIGNDINPLSGMLCLPRLNTPSAEAVSERLNEIKWMTPGWSPNSAESDLLAFYHPNTLNQLCSLQRYLLSNLDPVDAWIRMVALNRLTGHSPGYFSVYSLPPNQAASLISQRKINFDRKQTPPERDVAKLILKKTKTLLKDGQVISVNPSWHTGAAWDMPDIETSTVSLVVTSPPFLDVVQYQKDNWLRLWFAKIDPENVKITQLKNVLEWQATMRDVLIELSRVVRTDGHVAFEVGEVRGGTVLLEQLVWNAVEGLPFERVGVIVNGGSFTKTANIWKVDNNTKGTNTNRIVLLRRT